MIYNDIVYGKAEIDEPIILELLDTLSLQRLKGVEQAGYFKPFINYAHNRFDHSLGVMLLLKKYNASLEEQIAGLIHDVSHSVFSHAIDYALYEGSEKEHNHQDNIFKNYVKNSEIPEILNKYNFNIDYILDDNNFKLKENELPDLCADRIDYSLRETICYGVAEKKITNLILDNLIVCNNKWVFKDYEFAQIFADNFYKLNKNFYSGLTTAIMFRTVGDFLKYCLKNNYISKNDLYTTDNQVLNKAYKHFGQDNKLKLLFDRMNNKTKIINNPDNYDSTVYCKSRAVDPLCYHKNSVKKISDINPNWKEILNKEMKPKKYFLKFY